jgi:hypothetical protein
MNGRLKNTVLELRWSLITLAAALLIGGALISASAFVEGSKAQAHQQAQTRLRAARLQLDNLRREEANFSAYRDAYQSLAAKGLFGQEQRLAWIEYMNQLSARGEVQSVSYEISAEKPLPINLPEAKNVEVLASRVQLKMGFVHEGNLVRTLDDLRRTDTGFYRIDNCAMRRASEAAEPKAGENVTADCLLQWIVLRQKAVGGPR